MAKPFDEWLNKRYSSPVEILLEDIVALSHKAADCNALINEQTLTKLGPSHLMGNGKRIYLPNLRNIKDSKQYLVIRMGVTGESAPIPIVIFRSYRTSFETQSVYSPAGYLWRKFREEKDKPQHTQTNSSTYNDSIAQFKALQKSLEEEEREVRASAFDAAQVAIRRLYKKSQQVKCLPSILQQKGITQYIPDEARICHSTVSSKVYLSTKDEWKDTVIAYPRDLIIPIYDDKFKNIINVQVISANNPSRKRFIPGGPTQTLSMPLATINNIEATTISPIRVILEGYRTAKAAEFLHSKSALGIPTQFFVGFSASNIPFSLSNIEKAFGHIPTFTAFDHDAQDSDYAKQAIELGAFPLPAPTHKRNADWADVLTDYPLDQAIECWKRSLISALEEANSKLKEQKNKRL
ncbi:hypothetical protein ACUT8K_002931 [Vibrio parahaemolyticus]|uniref:hypothetical protein n=1 Tax=Vibrio parahaemolyticus TaxID=670 RepID=UPI0004D6717B|nr:hypothetical protein [Vibrio parahaemolyticus]EGQ8679244.1 hypothetical protein [Vibrio parahaemolyticus]EGQ8753661.1 hypothetical protein [Vibrio parahaemolyticus]EGQ8757476.1 hypothetical protein [Vibrio parahaemolyticus]EGQ8771761.1 hypothetical protein [Vibrio parahaemolyticus]EGQ8803505.1 hypothetical protein [Vibrio parahaemolyticus]